MFLPSLHLLAHEVYVLTPEEIKLDKQKLPRIRLLDALNSGHNVLIFIIATLVIAALIALGLWLKSKPPLQRLGRLIDRAGVVAPDIIRLVFGFALISSSIRGTLFGPELPLSSIPHGNLLKPIMLVIGTAIMLGFATKLASAIALAIWLFALLSVGWYILTYTNYLGEALATIFFPLQLFSIDRLLYKFKLLPKALGNFHPELSMPAARVFFGFALLFTAINIKILQPVLTLDTVNRYDLTRVFPFQPLFVVLGAGLVEILIALLYMAGLLRRAVTIVFLVFLIASVLFFKEAVWPHYLLIALGIGIFLHEPDKYALDKYLFPYRAKPLKRS